MRQKKEFFMDMLRIEDALRQLVRNPDMKNSLKDMCILQRMFEELPLDKQQLLTVRHYDAMCIFKAWAHGEEEPKNNAFKKAT
jgi:hypothetical protein